MEPIQNDIKQSDKQRYVDAWFDSLSTASKEYDKEFDSKITYIGAGVIALSIAFASRDSTLPLRCINLFIIGEIFAIGAVVLNLASFTISKILTRKYQNIVAKYIGQGYKGSLKPAVDQQEVVLYVIILCYNIFCLISLIVGIIFISIFVFKNLPS